MTDNKNQASNLGVPAAIVIAGGLIALAVYFGGSQGKGNSQVAALGDQAGVSVQPTAPTEIKVGDIRPITEADWVRGPADAPVTIVEYSDLECPFCKRFHISMKQIVSDYNGQVRWVYRHFPLDQLHQQARPEAVAVECAGEQGKGWELMDKIYEVTPSNDGLDLATLPQLAAQVGVKNTNQFSECLKSGKFDDKVVADENDAQVAGGRGTPYSVIITRDGDKIPVSGAQPIDKIKVLIDAALQQG